MSNEKTINFTFNFHAPVGQSIAHVEKLEAHFDKDMTMQVVDTKGLVDADSLDSEEESEKKSSSKVSESVKKCFRFPSEFVKQEIVTIVNDFYLNKPVNLAIIEIALYDHGQLYKRNSHTSFICALMDWGILSEDTDIRKTANGMATKFKSFPLEGYMKWDDYYLNERMLCINIGKKLPVSMKYNR